MNAGVQPRKENVGTDDDFVPISLQAILIDSVLEFDLYQERAGGMRLFRHRRFPISQEDIDRLAEAGYVSLHVPGSQRKEVLDHTIRILPEVLENNATPTEVKLQILTETSIGILERVLNDPQSSTDVQRSVDNCRNHVMLAMQGDDAQKAMVDGQPVAPPPIAHAIQVCNLSILLGMRCRVLNANDVHALGVGALLHEIGKRLIDRNYYFDENEYHRITDTRLKKYPLIGRNVLAKVGVMPRLSLRLVAEHQERLDGSGFPQRLRASEICTESRVIAICDYYDETLNGGNGSNALTPFQVLKTMKESSTKFDRHILVEFIRLLGTGLVLDCR